MNDCVIFFFLFIVGRMSTVKSNKPFVPARNIDVHFDIRDMVPFYTKLTDSVYQRPVVVTFLFPRSYCRKLHVSSPPSISKKETQHNSSSPNFNDSILYESSTILPDSPTNAGLISNQEDDMISVDLNQQKVKDVINHARISKYFVVTVSDIVESRDASYKVIVRDFKDLLKEIKSEYDGSSAVEDYFNPQSLRWWITYIDQVLLVFDRPSGKLGALVDKGKICQRVKRKMEHHQWMLKRLHGSTSNGDGNNELIVAAPNRPDLNLTSTMVEMMNHFEQLPDDPHLTSVSQELTQNELRSQLEKGDVLEDSIEDLAVIGFDDLKTFSKSIDSLEAEEVNEEIDVASTYQAPGSVTANILDDVSLSVSIDFPKGENTTISKTTNSRSHQGEVKRTPIKKKTSLLESSAETRKDPKPSRIRSSQRTTKQLMHNPSSSHDKPATPTRHISPETQLSSTAPLETTKSLRNSTSLPAISQVPHKQNMKTSTIPQVISEKQGRTNQLLEDAYGIAATKVLFPASYAREEERLRQSLVTALPGHKAKKNLSLAAQPSSVSRSHDGKLPSLTQSSTLPVPTNFIIFDHAADEPKDESSIDLSEIVHHVADKVRREIAEHEALEANERQHGKTGSSKTDADTSDLDEKARSESVQFAGDDLQFDPYRQVSIATSFLGLERCVSPQPRPESPFAEEMKNLRGSQKIAAEIIHRARKGVSGNSKFQVRKISFSEKKLLDSPFAKKLWIEHDEDTGTTVKSIHQDDETTSPHRSSTAALPTEEGSITSFEVGSYSTANHHTAAAGTSGTQSSAKKRASTSVSSHNRAPSRSNHKPQKRGSTAATNTTSNKRSLGNSHEPQLQTHNVEQESVLPDVLMGSKIVYLETDDSVLVEERLEMTISCLAPEVPPVSDANTLAQEEALLKEQRLFVEQEQETQERAKLLAEVANQANQIVPIIAPNSDIAGSEGYVAFNDALQQPISQESALAVGSEGEQYPYHEYATEDGQNYYAAQPEDTSYEQKGDEGQYYAYDSAGASAGTTELQENHAYSTEAGQNYYDTQPEYDYSQHEYQAYATEDGQQYSTVQPGDMYSQQQEYEGQYPAYDNAVAGEYVESTEMPVHTKQAAYYDSASYEVAAPASAEIAG